MPRRRLVSRVEALSRRTKGVGYFIEDNHERAEARGPLFGIAHGNGLRNQLADNQRQVGDEGDGGHHGQIGGIGLCPRYQGKQGHQVVGNVGTSVGTRNDADERDAYLDGGKKFFGFFQLLQHSFGPFVPLTDQGFQTCLAGGNECDFVHGKDAVQY